jgi:hypothetical protein
MSDINSKMELALRLRRDADATAMPHYASLMRRAADDLDAVSQLERSTPMQRQRQAC